MHFKGPVLIFPLSRTQIFHGHDLGTRLKLTPPWPHRVLRGWTRLTLAHHKTLSSWRKRTCFHFHVYTCVTGKVQTSTSYAEASRPHSVSTENLMLHIEWLLSLNRKAMTSLCTFLTIIPNIRDTKTLTSRECSKKQCFCDWNIPNSHGWLHLNHFPGYITSNRKQKLNASIFCLLSKISRDSRHARNNRFGLS